MPWEAPLTNTEGGLLEGNRLVEMTHTTEQAQEQCENRSVTRCQQWQSWGWGLGIRMPAEWRQDGRGRKACLWQPGKQIGAEPERWQGAHTEHCFRNLQATTSGLSYSNYSNTTEMGEGSGLRNISEVELAELWK